MAWTGMVNSINKNNGRALLNVTIAGPLGTFTRDITVDFISGSGTPADFNAWLKRQAMTWAAQIDAVYAWADTVPQNSPVDFTPDTITLPDAAYLAFQAQVLLLRRLGAAVKAGVIPSSQAQYVNAQAAVLAGLTANPGWVIALDGLVF